MDVRPYRGRAQRWLWKKKSKKPYVWSASSCKWGNNVPWLAFVGYQVHRGGRLRIRKKSLDRENAKQRKVVHEILGGIDRAKHRARKAGRIACIPRYPSGRPPSDPELLQHPLDGDGGDQRLGLVTGDEGLVPALAVEDQLAPNPKAWRAPVLLLRVSDWSYVVASALGEGAPVSR